MTTDGSTRDDTSGNGGPPAALYSRRAFLQLAGAGAATATAMVHFGGRAWASGTPVNLTFSANVSRRADGLNIVLRGFNLTLDKSDAGRPVLRRTTSEGGAYLVLDLPPQSILEEAFPVPGDDPTARPVSSRLARRSRIALNVPAGTTVRYDLPSILAAMTTLDAKLTPIAASDGKPATDVRKPLDYETSVEMPWSLVINPDSHQRWRSSDTDPPENGLVPLWHADLETTPVGQFGIVNYPQRFRAVWAEDPDFYDPVKQEGRFLKPGGGLDEKTPFLASLTSAHRAYLVQVTSGRSKANRPLYGVTPATYNRLMVTGLGGWLDTDNVWAKDGLEWTHRLTGGRDHFVRVVNEGYLLPLNLKAAEVILTERRVAPNGTAYLRKQTFILLRELSRNYATGLVHQRMKNQGRGMPFRSVRTTTLRSAPLVEPRLLAGDVAGDAYVPVEESGEFRLKMVGIDWDGQEVHFSAPAVFVHKAAAETSSACKTVVNAYEGVNLSDNLRRSTLGSQQVHFAPPSAPGRGDTALPTETIVWGLELPISADEAWFKDNQWAAAFPRLHRADVVIESIAAITGTPMSTGLDYFRDYLENGLNGAGIPTNKAEVFLKLAQQIPTPPPVALPPGLAGNLVAPPVNIAGLSRRVGVLPAGAASNVNPFGRVPAAQKLIGALAAGSFDPKKVLENLQAKLLGTVDLVDIIKAATDYLDPAQSGPNTLISTKKEGGVETVLTWQPVLQDDPVLGAFQTLPRKADGSPDTSKLKTKMKLVATTFVPGRGSTAPARAASTIDISDFRLQIPGSKTTAHGLLLTFKRLQFSAGTDRATDVKPDIESVEFTGALKMLQPVVDLLGFAPKGGGGAGSNEAGNGGAGAGKAPKPFSHKITAKGIEVTLTVNIPKISLGAFVLKNLSIGAGATLPLTPFTDDPGSATEDLDGKAVAALKGFTFHLKVGTKKAPVELTVAFFKGSAYVSVAGGGKGLDHLAIAFDFGATYSLDLGIASGGVSAVGGFSFSMTKVVENGVEGQHVTFTAYLKLSGHLDILGLITASIVFNLELTYENNNGKERLFGRATLHISIEVAMFSKTVTLETEKEFAGSGGGGGNGSASPAGGEAVKALTEGSASDLTFESLFQHSDQWATYARAYA